MISHLLPASHVHKIKQTLSLVEASNEWRDVSAWLHGLKVDASSTQSLDIGKAADHDIHILLVKVQSWQISVDRLENGIGCISSAIMCLIKILLLKLFYSAKWRISGCEGRPTK